MTRKSILIFLSILFYTSCMTAQTPTTTYNQLGFSYSNIDPIEDLWFIYHHHTLQLEYTHGLNRKFSVGAYIGYGLYREWWTHEVQSISYNLDETLSRIDTLIAIENVKMSSSVHYGINGIAHLLPILNRNSSYHDVYINARVGMISMFTKNKGENINPQRGHYFNYSLVGGYTFYAWQHVGFFVEYGFNISKYTKRTSVRYGMKFDL